MARVSEGIEKLEGGQRKWLKRVAIFAGILLGYLGWQLWDIDRFGHHDEGGSADCAIVLGAAAYYNRPSPVFRARIDHAVKLYREGRVEKILLTGGFGKDAEYAESEVAYQYCLEKGVPEKDLLLEDTSKTTEQNLIQAARVMEANGLETALLVSDPWHLKRAAAMARKHGIKSAVSATETTMYRSASSRWGFLWRELYHIHVWRFAGEN